jgi:uncharacterized protein (TIGR02588 family)
MTGKGGSRRSGPSRQRTPFEWALLFGSLAATLAVIAGLVMSGLVGPRGPADLRVTVTDAGGRTSSGRPLGVRVENIGGTSAENVIIEVTVGDVSREVNLDLVAKGDEESATVVLPDDAAGQPEAEVVSYTNP